MKRRCDENDLHRAIAEILTQGLRLRGGRDVTLAEFGRGRRRNAEVIENLAPQLVGMNDGMAELALEVIGAGERRTMVTDDDRVTVATLMTCTLSIDHRVVDGALGAEFLQAFKSLIEAPLSMLV